MPVISKRNKKLIKCKNKKRPENYGVQMMKIQAFSNKKIKIRVFPVQKMRVKMIVMKTL